MTTPDQPSRLPVLSAHGVSKIYGGTRHSGAGTSNVRTGFIAVDNVDLALMPARTLGVVGESGCGKSTLSRILAGITTATQGTVRIDGQSIVEGTRQQRRKLLSDVQMVFQSPAGSLDPRMRIDKIVVEPLDIHRPDLGKKGKRELVSSIMQQVGLDDSFLSRYPHELSGGQQQRIGIARALITNPKVAICDEAVSALDVSVQAQIINLLLDIQTKTGVAFIFISHDLSVVAAIADEIAVMYMGKIVEEGAAQTVLSRPAHPYTSVLLESAFIPDPLIEKQRMRARVEDAGPAEGRPAQGCPFRPRCRIALPKCATVMPELEITDRGDTRVACHNYRSNKRPQ